MSSFLCFLAAATLPFAYTSSPKSGSISTPPAATKVSNPIQPASISHVEEQEDQLIQELFDTQEPQPFISPYEAMAPFPRSIREYKNASQSSNGERRDLPRTRKTLDYLRSALLSVVDEEEDQLIQELFINKEPKRFISPYEAMAQFPRSIREYKNASGNWFGCRDYLDNHGIEFSTTYTSDIAGNPVGGRIPGGFTYADNFTFACLVETEKLFGWHGGFLRISTLQRDGLSLSQKNIGSFYRVQQLADGYTFKWYELSYQQDFLKDRWSFKLGRLGINNDFDVSPLYWLYMNHAIDGTTRGFAIDGKLPTYPNAVWGSRLKVNLTSSTALRLGIYQMTTPSLNGLNWNFYPSNGTLLLGQYSWSPEFCKPTSLSEKPQTPSLNPSTSGKKEVSEKSFQKPVDVSKLKGLEGHYWMGGYYSSWEYRQLNTPQNAPNSFGLYWHADQTVYRPNPISDAGLILWSSYTLCPQENISIVTFQANAGAIYTGLIPGRVNDSLIFGSAYGDFSNSLAGTPSSVKNGTPTYELIYELAYRVNFTKFFYFQPDLQWIINPGGTGHIPNALVLGAQMGVIF
ncbi:MAG: carbohydrate porin [Verrucomicrobiae bacterium]|jgi:porin|nr:carbohydrate porin [Verrucomicrobiae bacterium]